jgi:hypothetical protein
MKAVDLANFLEWVLENYTWDQGAFYKDESENEKDSGLGYTEMELAITYLNGRSKDK